MCGMFFRVGSWKLGFRMISTCHPKLVFKPHIFYIVVVEIMEILSGLKLSLTPSYSSELIHYRFAILSDQELKLLQ